VPTPSPSGAGTGTAVEPAPGPADDRRPCPSCGAANLASSTFCWQCQTPYRQPPSAYGSSAAQAPSWPGRSGLDYRPIPDYSPPPKQRSIGAIVGALVFAVAVIGGFFAYRLLTSPGAQLPDSLAGSERLEIPAIESELDRFKDEVARLGFEGDVAMYGTAGVPSFMVMVIDESPGDAQIEDSLLQQFADGFSSGGSLRIDVSSIDVLQEGDATLRCTSITGGPQLSMCMWVDPDTLGFVFTFLQTVDPTRELTRQIRTTLQA
jgi:hypothetical protein